mgnify:FL=1
MAKRKRHGPTKRDPKRRAMILAAIAGGNPFRFACQCAGISEDMFANWRREESDFAEAVKAAEGRFIDRNVAIVQRAAKRSWQAAAWLLERRNPDEFGRRERHEWTGRDGGPVEHAVTFYLPANPRLQLPRSGVDGNGNLHDESPHA